MVSVTSERVTRYTGVGPESVDMRLYLLIGLGTILGAGHHLDHVLRGNHVGWPVSPEVTMFTYSLGFYPLFLIGLYLTLRERVGAGYWTLVLTAGALLVTVVHFGPWAIEPPKDIIQPYSNPSVGYLAFVWLIGFVGTFWLGAVYSAYRWLASTDVIG